MRTRFWLAGAVVLAALLFWPAPAARVGEGVTVPGDARRGALLFRKQRCIECHSFQGVGGTAAPDLGRRSAREYTPDRLAAVMWNHAPAMWEAMAQKGIAVPALNQEEAADLYAYFYSVRYFERPGDAGRGKAIFAAKRCSHCHALRAGEPRIGRAVGDWKAVSEPVAMIQEMWNHSEVVLEKMQQERIRWPRLSAQELVDVLVYLQNLRETRSAQADFAPSDPQQGRAVFQQKGCGNCHTLGVREAGKKDLLAAERLPGSMTEFAAAMWNHAPEMYHRAKRSGASIPTFRGAQMNHLVGYLLSMRFFDEKGDARRGRRVFVRKNCSSCHEQKAVSAPDLARFRGQVSPMFVTAALWKHGPEMLPRMKQRGYRWPGFFGAEMADLIAYLNRKP